MSNNSTTTKTYMDHTCVHSLQHSCSLQWMTMNNKCHVAEGSSATLSIELSVWSFYLHAVQAVFLKDYSM